MPDKHRSETSSGPDKPIYNDNPLFLRGHLEGLYEWLPDTNPNHLNLAGGYFLVVNRKTIVMSAEHSAAIKDGSLVTPTDFRATFIKPIDPKRWKATSTPLPSADADRFTIQPEAIRTGLNEMLSDIVGSFEDTESGKDAKKEAGNCPITLLNQMKDEADNITNTMVGKIDDLMSKMMEDGLPSATLSGFSHFRKGYTSLNLALHDDETLSDAKLAKRFAKVVRSLGTVADTAMRFEMLKRTADGNLAQTIKACKTVLGDMEANDKGGALGAALTAGGRRDPSIFPPGGGGGTPTPGASGDRKKGHPDRPFDASRDRNCFNCKTGEHWTADCTLPRRDSAKAKKAAKWKERRDKEKSKREAEAAPSPAPAHGKSGRGSGSDDATDTATAPVLIQDAEARLAAAFSAGGTVNFAEQIAMEASTTAQARASLRKRRSMNRSIILARPKWAMGSRCPLYRHSSHLRYLQRRLLMCTSPPAVLPLRTTATTNMSSRPCHGSRRALQSLLWILTPPWGPSVTLSLRLVYPCHLALEA